METVFDPLCGRIILPTATMPKSEFQGKAYYFCCDLCKQLFDREPQKHAVKKVRQSTDAQRAVSQHSEETINKRQATG